MAARRVSTIAARAILSSSQQTAPRILSSPFRAAPAKVTRISTSPIAGLQVRWNSAASAKSKNYDFNAVKSLSESPDSNKIIIDVREPAEYEGGYIPGAINIPVSSAPDALFMPGHEFEDKFGFAKPKADQELVFYCKAGVRSRAAAQLAQQVGYKNVSEYPGSWMDWQKNGGKVEK